MFTHTFFPWMGGKTKIPPRLPELLAKIKGKFLLTVNDYKETRSLYKRFSKLKVNVKY